MKTKLGIRTIGSMGEARHWFKEAATYSSFGFKGRWVDKVGYQLTLTRWLVARMTDAEVETLRPLLDSRESTRPHLRLWSRKGLRLARIRLGVI